MLHSVIGELVWWYYKGLFVQWDEYNCIVMFQSWWQIVVLVFCWCLGTQGRSRLGQSRCYVIYIFWILYLHGMLVWSHCGHGSSFMKSCLLSVCTEKDSKYITTVMPAHSPSSMKCVEGNWAQFPLVKSTGQDETWAYYQVAVKMKPTILRPYCLPTALHDTLPLNSFCVSCNWQEKN